MKAMAGKMAVAGVLVHLLGQVVAMSVMINVEANADGAVPLPVFRTAWVTAVRRGDRWTGADAPRGATGSARASCSAS
ncbi:hypothetical protein DFJ74DRAFT_698138 [Hyaloraphidium curvatum]|nr:hypothetical protein DFJ74DRAFT_698138 [Hyaloraphidium curvatum]